MLSDETISALKSQDEVGQRSFAAPPGGHHRARAVAPNGIGTDAYRIALRDGVSGVGAITLFDAEDLECRVAAEVKNLPTVRFPDPARGAAGRPRGAVVARRHRGSFARGGRLLAAPQSRRKTVLGRGHRQRRRHADFTEEQYRRYFSDQLRRVSAYNISSSTPGGLSSESLTPLRFSRTEPSDFDGLYQLHRCAQLRVQYDSLSVWPITWSAAARMRRSRRHHARVLCHARGLSFAQP